MKSLHMTRREVLAAAAGLTAFSGCQSILSRSENSPTEPTFGETESVWPMLGHDPQNTGSTEVSFPDGSFSTKQLFRAANEDRTAAPIHAADTVFVSRADEAEKPAGAYRLKPADGDEQWRAPDASGYTTPSVYGQTVFLSGGGQTTAVNIDSGEIHWQQPLGASGFHLTHLIHDDTLILRSGNKLVGANAFTGDQQWESSNLGVIFGFATDTSRIYAARNAGQTSGLVALDRASGNVQWTANGMSGIGRPAVSDGLVFHTDSETATLRAVHATDGSDAWQFTAKAGIEPETANAPPAISPDGGRMFFGFVDESHQSHLVALDATTGEQQWSVTGIGTNTQPIVTRDRIFLGGWDTIFAISRSNRKVTGQFTLPGSLSSPLALGPERLYFTVRSDRGRCQKCVAQPN